MQIQAENKNVNKSEQFYKAWIFNLRTEQYFKVLQYVPSLIRIETS